MIDRYTIFQKKRPEETRKVNLLRGLQGGRRMVELSSCTTHCFPMIWQQIFFSEEEFDQIVENYLKQRRKL